MNDDHTKGLISIIIPAYNRAYYLEDALRSIERQSYRPIQVIVVDDGSTDETRSLVSNWESKTRSDEGLLIEYYYQTNQGACTARNLGIMRAEGEFIQFLDSDDVLYPYAIEWAVDHFMSEPVDYVHFNVHRSDENLIPIPGAYLGRAPTGTSQDVCAYLWHTMGAVYRREAVAKVGLWNEALAGSQDWEFAARIKLHSLKGVYDERVMGLFRDHTFQRIGVRNFSHRYVTSVELACDSIAGHAKRLGKLDSTIRRALARRLLVHAVEFGANGFEEDKDRLLRKSLRLGPGGPLMSGLIKSFRVLPSKKLAAGLLQVNQVKGRLAAMGQKQESRFGAPPEHLRHGAMFPGRARYRYAVPPVEG